MIDIKDIIQYLNDIIDEIHDEKDLIDNKDIIDNLKKIDIEKSTYKPTYTKEIAEQWLKKIKDDLNRPLKYPNNILPVIKKKIII